MDRLMALLGGSSTADAPKPGLSKSGSAPFGKTHERTVITRQSHGLEQFFASMRDRGELALLDFAEASQSNITFITNLGHKISSEDYVRSLERAFGEEDFYAAQSDPERVDPFLRENLTFSANRFDGVLLWDSLQFLTPPLIQHTADRLYEITKPGANLLAFFHTDDKVAEIPVYNYRITDAKTLQLALRSHRKQAHFFNNRTLEKIFQRFESVKFFLTRDHLREIIVKR
ncbi:MAG: class I SAM-dependent methyltransferase [Bryobacteraceae bacterium]|nr:class I SAM-dependent methyltransferase [Bryobacteraceae bacterium]